VETQWTIGKGISLFPIGWRPGGKCAHTAHHVSTFIWAFPIVYPLLCGIPKDSVVEPKLIVSASAPTSALWVPVYTAFKIICWFFIIFIKDYRLNSLVLILFNMNYDLIYYFIMTQSRELEPNLHISAPVRVKSFRLLATPVVAPAPQHCPSETTSMVS
jgi:hypothetical protein